MVGSVIISYTYETCFYITHDPVIPNLLLFFSYVDGKCEKQPLFDLLLGPNCLREEQDQCAKKSASEWILVFVYKPRLSEAFNASSVVGRRASYE